jgi:nitroimidazol reductase NimA-like FMN-containing flavoprotein (pyridoxamine 5'-phosphate oxidase superfamily)
VVKNDPLARPASYRQAAISPTGVIVPDFPPTDLNRLHRLPKRGHYDRAIIYPILDAALIGHVAFVEEDQPFVIPTLFARDGDRLLIHGASTSRMIRHLQAGHPASFAVTILDGLVMARSIFEHSLNYRSAVLFGRGLAVEEPDEKMSALRLFTERLMAGRWDDVRPPSPTELKATGVVSLTIESATAKVRSGPPTDFPEDLHLPAWAGVVPLRTAAAPPRPSPDLAPGTPFPPYLQALLRRLEAGADGEE